MDKLNTMRFRKHPGGLRSGINVSRRLFPIFVIVSGLMVIFSFWKMIDGDSEITVVARNPYLISIREMPDLPRPKLTGEYKIKPDNIIVRMVAYKGFKDFGFLNSVVNFLIVFYLYLIFRNLDLEAPFSLRAARYIRLIGIIWLIGWVLESLAGLYVANVVKVASGGEFKPLTSRNEYSVVPGFIILIISRIYLRGCELQEEKDLTI